MFSLDLNGNNEKKRYLILHSCVHVCACMPVMVLLRGHGNSTQQPNGKTKSVHQVCTITPST